MKGVQDIEILPVFRLTLQTAQLNITVTGPAVIIIGS